MSKDSKTGQRATRQPTPTKIIVERHYVGTEKMETEKAKSLLYIAGFPKTTAQTTRA